eukprot:g2350.t1
MKSDDDVASSRTSSRRRQRPLLRNLIFGSLSGIVGLLVVHPLDTIRTRLQVQATERAVTNTSTKNGKQASILYKNAWHCASQTVKEEGIQTLYRGLIYPLVAQGVYKGVIFSAFHIYNNIFNHNNVASSSNSTANTTNQQQSVIPSFHVFSGGVFAGTINSFVVSPVELFRNRMMTQKFSRSHSFYRANPGLRPISNLNCIKQTLKDPKTGRYQFTNLWRGLQATILRDGPGVGFWFYSFHLAKNIQTSDYYIDNNNTHLFSSLQSDIIAGSCAGLGYWFWAFPLDTMKSIVQTTDKRSVNMLYLIRTYFRYNVDQLYRGLGVTLFRGVLSSSVVFATRGWLIDNYST